MVTMQEFTNRMKELAAKFQADPSAENLAAIQALTKEMDKAKAELAKVQAEKARIEAEQLAGEREALELAIFKALRAGEAIPDLAARLQKVKSWGFTYRLDRVDESVTPPVKITETKANLLVKTVKSPRASGGGGGTGKTLEQFGRSLANIYEEYATAEERAELDAAKAKETEKGITNSGLQHQVKKSVLKRVIAAGLVKPVK